MLDAIESAAPLWDAKRDQDYDLPTLQVLKLRGHRALRRDSPLCASSRRLGLKFPDMFVPCRPSSKFSKKNCLRPPQIIEKLVPLSSFGFVVGVSGIILVSNFH